jgi:hypothetical protein
MGKKIKRYEVHYPPTPSAWGLWGESTTGGREELGGGDGIRRECTTAPRGGWASLVDPSAVPPPAPNREQIAPPWLHTQYQQQPPDLPCFRPPLLVVLSSEAVSSSEAVRASV